MSVPWWIAAAVFVAAIGSTKEAVEAIGAGAESTPEALAYLRARGRPGLWSVHAAAKRASGPRRVRLLASLGELPFEGAAWALKEAYGRGDRASRLGAVRGLGRLEGSGVRRILLEAARAEDPEIREAAARGLARRVDAVRDEVAALLYEPDVEAVTVALRVATASRDPELTRRALPVGLGHDAPEVQQAALELMAATGAEIDVPAARALARSAKPDIGPTAVAALAATANPERFRWIGVLLADPRAPERTRDAAFRALASGGGAGFATLTSALGRAPDAETRLRRGIDRPVPEARIRRWIDALASSDPRTRRVAATALRVIGAPAHRPLIARLADPDRRVAARAQAYLLEVAGDELDRELQRAARSDDASLRAGAVAARIRRSEGPDGATRHASALDDPAPIVRAAAARALAAVGQSEADALVLERAGDEAMVDVAFLDGVAQRPGTSIRETLALRLLDSDDPDVRRRAIEVLTPASDATVLEALVQRLPAAPLDEKQQILESVATSRVPEAATTLVDLVTHVDPQIREAAQRYVAER